VAEDRDVTQGDVFGLFTILAVVSAAGIMKPRLGWVALFIVSMLMALAAARGGFDK
jgi:hypothetical protein